MRRSTPWLAVWSMTLPRIRELRMASSLLSLRQPVAKAQLGKRRLPAINKHAGRKVAGGRCSRIRKNAGLTLANFPRILANAATIARLILVCSARCIPALSHFFDTFGKGPRIGT